MQLTSHIKTIGWITVVLVITGSILFGCQGQSTVIGAQDAAERVYVAPGEYDEYYAFLSL